MIDGILVIDKQEGITSYTVINKLKKVLPKGQKIGHAGTLDPFATGVLPILLGKATKLMNKIHEFEKEYLVTAEFGYMTDTQDGTGEILKKEDNPTPLEKEEIGKIVKENFIGNISQLPPRYSAKKVAGMRAYDLAREGKEFELTPKDISVSEFEIVDYNWPSVKFRIVCSTGTYIRTLVNDLGIKLGTYATAIELRRTHVGPFKVEEGISSEDIKEGIDGSIIDLDKVNQMISNE